MAIDHRALILPISIALASGVLANIALLLHAHDPEAHGNAKKPQPMACPHCPHCQMKAVEREK